MECKNHSGSAISLGHFGGREVMTRYAVAILLALTIPASAEDTTTANQMLPGCKGLLDDRMTSGVSVYQQGRCGGYVASLVYGVGEQEFCSPKGVSIGQAVAVVIKYIEARPERMHEQFGDLALEALKAAWPCKR
jgi:Ssp1 endopeptidase immunity protein Rap1a